MGEKQIRALLGEKAIRGRAFSSRFALADLIARGLPQRSLQRVKAALQLSDVELATAIGMSQKTISRLRKKPEATLGAVASDRVYRLAALFSMAREVLGEEQEAREWLRAPQIGLNNRIPLELMGTEIGAREVENLLGRIEHGVLS